VIYPRPQYKFWRNVSPVPWFMPSATVRTYSVDDFKLRQKLMKMISERNIRTEC